MQVLGELLLAVAIALEAGLLYFGVGNLASYWTLKPDRERSFAQIRVSDQESRSIVWPAFSALLAGFLISLSASFLYGDITSGRESATPLWGIFFFAALTVFVVFLAPVLRGEPPLEEQARFPQRILTIAKSLGGEDPDDANTLRILQERLSNWEANGAAFSIGWRKLRPSPGLNTAFSQVPSSKKLQLRAAVRSLRGRRVVQAAWAAAPWRFGWPVYVLSGLSVAGLVVLWVDGSYAPGWLLVIPGGVVAVAVHWSSRALCGARRLAIARSFVQPCKDELAAVQARIDRAHAREQAWGAALTALDALNADIRELRVSQDSVRTDRRFGGGVVLGMTAAMVLLASVGLLSRLAPRGE